MYLRRFKNKEKKRLLQLKGSFSFIYLGGGAFLYNFPGKYHPIVGKFELGRKRNRVRGLSLLFGIFLVFGYMTLFSDAGTADSVSLERLEELEKGLSPVELEEKSEQIKQHLLNMNANDPYRHRGDTKRKIIEYKVMWGDTLSEIAAKHRVPIEMITASSRIQISSIIKPGQKLTIPYRPGLVYKFKRGDRLATVAQYYSVKLEAIMRENPDMESPDIISPGTRLFLPNAKIPAPPPTWFRPIWGRITSRFGMRRHPLHRRRRMHSGIDIGASYRSVKAARSGHVIFSGNLGSYGKTIIIEHTSGYKTLYAHLSRMIAKKGDYVKARKKIGISGNSGISTGPHLHFEIIRHGRAVNPRRKIRF